MRSGFAAIELCTKKGFNIADTAIYAGLKNTHWEARLEVCKISLFFFSMELIIPRHQRLCRSLKKDFSYRRLILIFGALADKDYSQCYKNSSSRLNKILTQLKQAGCAGERYYETVKKMGYPAIVTENVKQAIERHRP